MPKNRKRSTRRPPVKANGANANGTTANGANASGADASRRFTVDAKAVELTQRAGMGTNLKVTLGLIGLAVVITAVALATNLGGGGLSRAEVAQRLVRADSHRLSTATDGKVTVVEFLDFECGPCGAAYPSVEKLRKEYDGRITYVVRYFPLSIHHNADNAARAVQSAARQDKFEAMYIKMFDTQASWGGQQTDHTATFEQYARDIGLDLDRYRADVSAQATADRVGADRQDGLDLGVKGTPTFFINGERFDDQPTYEHLKSAVDAALAT